MFHFQTQVRVRYSETDQMGYVYYGHYASYYEVARVEALRSLGIVYKNMEESAILMPVIEYNIKYLKPAFYDEVLTIKIVIPHLPSAKILFQYEIYNEQGELLNKAETVLVFVQKESKRPTRIPEYLEKLLKPYFE